MNKKSIIITALIGLCLFSHDSLAVQNLRPLPTDNRIKVVTYQSDNVVPVQGITFITTQIIFGNNEKIVDVQGGDAAAWTISIDSVLANVLNIKPTTVGSHSNLSVITLDDSGKRRFYHFDLESVAQGQTNNTGTYAIQFIYPDEQRAALLAQLNYQQAQKQTILNASQNPADYNWDYSFNGAHSIMPLHIFDDGKFTYLQLRPNQPLPAIFAVNNTAGQESVVNYRKIGDYLVIEQVSPQFTLRAGKYTVASIFNNPLVKQMQRHG